MRSLRPLYPSIGGFLFASLLLGVLGWLSYRQFLKVREAKDLVTHTLLVREKTRALQSLIQEAESGQRAFLITADHSYLLPYQAAVQQLPDEIQQLRELTRDNATQQAYLRELEPLIATKMTGLRESIQSREHNDFETVSRELRGMPSDPTMERIRSLLSSMLHEETRLYDDRESYFAQSAKRATSLSIGGLSLAIGLVGFSGLALAFQYGKLQQVEDSLRESEQRYRVLVQGVQDYAIFGLDTTGHVTSWNAGAERMNGYSAEEIGDCHISRFYPLEDARRGKPARMLEIAVEEGQAEDEGWRVRKDGSHYWANTIVTALRDPEGRLVGFSKITRDLSERKKVEKALHDSEERFRAVAETAHEAIVSANDEGNIIQWNKGATLTFGYSASETLGKPLTLIMPERFHAGHVCGMRRYLSTRKANMIGKTTELTGRKKDGTEFPLELSLACWETADGVFFTGIMRDTTERKKVENALRELSSRLLRVQDVERQRIGRDLHDSAGQNLVILKLRLDSLVSKLSPEDPLRGKIQECSSMAEETLREVRATSYELYPPLLEEAGLESTIPWFLDGFAERSGIVTHLEMPSNIDRPPREVELALFRILQESLTNVRRHSGSSVADVRVFAQDGRFGLEVKDHGKGIAPEILDAFQRESLGKLGVGLRGMKARIRELGGKMEVSSNGQGTTVSVSVPISKA